MKQVPSGFILAICSAAFIILCTAWWSRAVVSDGSAFAEIGSVEPKTQEITVPICEVIVLCALGLCTITWALVEGFKSFAFLTMIFTTGLVIVSGSVFIRTLDVHTTNSIEYHNLSILYMFSAFSCVFAVAQVGVTVFLELASEKEVLRRAKIWLIFELFFTVFFALTVIVVTSSTAFCFDDLWSQAETYIKVIMLNVVLHQLAIPPLYVLLTLEMPYGLRGREKCSDPETLKSSPQV